MSDPKVAIDAVLDGTARYAVLCGDATEVMKIVPSETIHVSYNDPPYGLSEQTTESIVECLRAWLDGKVYTHGKNGFMQTGWDAYVPGPEAWREVNRVLKPGGYNVSFSSTRTVDLLGMAIRLAGFELREGMSWIQGCLSDDTEILIGDQWRKHSDVSIGDVAVCYNPHDGTYRR
jgi:site-specific DNA-methyltransferase (adenine-specific)